MGQVLSPLTRLASRPMGTGWAPLDGDLRDVVRIPRMSYLAPLNPRLVLVSARVRIHAAEEVTGSFSLR